MFTNSKVWFTITQLPLFSPLVSLNRRHPTTIRSINDRWHIKKAATLATLSR